MNKFIKGKTVYGYIREDDWSLHSSQAHHNASGDPDHLWEAVKEEWNSDNYRSIDSIVVMNYHAEADRAQYCAYVTMTLQ